MTTFSMLEIGRLKESRTNPRRHVDPQGLDELTASIKTKGVLVPLLVRPRQGADKAVVYEIVAGSRRYQAAKKAGLSEVPCFVRELSDLEVLETQVIENLQREDVHPLDEAEGYQALMGKGKYDVTKIADRVGRSVKYVYDRIKLLALCKEARALFWAGKITAGHAILLARLSAADQQRAIGDKKSGYLSGGLFVSEHVLWDPEEDDEPEFGHIKAVSVRELQVWIDQHVKFDVKAADPMLFPETVAEVKAAEKVVPITYDHFVRPDARDGQRVFGPRSWKRADGKHHSKPCEKSVTGVIVVGRRRGEAFKVCLDEKGCKTHYAQEQKEPAQHVKKAVVKWQQNQQQQAEKAKVEEARREAERGRWKKATPAILKAVADRVKKMPTRANGYLAGLIIAEVETYQGTGKKAAGYVPRGTTAEQALRHAAFVILAGWVQSWSAPEQFPKQAKALGLDIKKILDQAAPGAKAAVQTPGKPKGKKGKAA